MSGELGVRMLKWKPLSTSLLVDPGCACPEDVNPCRWTCPHCGYSWVSCANPGDIFTCPNCHQRSQVPDDIPCRCG